MMLIIQGLPSSTKYQDVKSLIKQQCNLSDFILDNLVSINGLKTLRIGTTDDADGHHLIKCLDGFRVAGCAIKVAPVAKAALAPKPQPIQNVYNTQPQYNQQAHFSSKTFNRPNLQTISMVREHESNWQANQGQGDVWQENQGPIQQTYGSYQPSGQQSFVQQQNVQAAALVAQRAYPQDIRQMPNQPHGNLNKLISEREDVRMTINHNHFQGPNQYGNVQPGYQQQPAAYLSHTQTSQQWIPLTQNNPEMYEKPNPSYTKMGYEEKRQEILKKSEMGQGSDCDKRRREYQERSPIRCLDRSPIRSRSARRSTERRYSPKWSPRRLERDNRVSSEKRKSIERRMPGDRRMEHSPDRRDIRRMSPHKRVSPHKGHSPRQSPGRRDERNISRYGQSRHFENNEIAGFQPSKVIKPAYESTPPASNQSYMGEYRPDVYEKTQHGISSQQTLQKRIPPWQDEKNMHPAFKEQDNVAEFGSRSPRRSRSPKRSDRSSIKDRFKRHSPSPQSSRRSWAAEKRISPELHDAPPPPSWPDRQGPSDYDRVERKFPDKQDIRTTVRDRNVIPEDSRRNSRDFYGRIQDHRFQNIDKIEKARGSSSHEFKHDKFSHEEYGHRVKERANDEIRQKSVWQRLEVRERSPLNDYQPRRDDRREKILRTELDRELEEVHKRAIEFKKKAEEFRRTDGRKRHESRNYYKERHYEDPETDIFVPHSDESRGYKEYQDRQRFVDHNRQDHREYFDDLPHSSHTDDQKRFSRKKTIKESLEVVKSNSINEMKAKKNKAVEEICKKILHKNNIDLNNEYYNEVYKELKIVISRHIDDMFGNEEVSFIEIVVKFNAKYNDFQLKRILEDIMSDFPRNKKRHAAEELPKIPETVTKHSSVSDMNAERRPNVAASSTKTAKVKLHADTAVLLEDELQKIMMKMWKQLPENPSINSNKIVVETLKYVAGDEIKKVLGLTTTSRLLNIFNPLIAKIHFSRKPLGSDVRVFLSKYNIAAIKKIKDQSNYFAIQVNNIRDFDRLHITKNLRCGDAKVTISSLYKFLKTPDEIKTPYNVADKTSNVIFQSKHKKINAVNPKIQTNIKTTLVNDVKKINPVAIISKTSTTVNTQNSQHNAQITTTKVAVTIPNLFTPNVKPDNSSSNTLTKPVTPTSKTPAMNKEEPRFLPAIAPPVTKVNINTPNRASSYEVSPKLPPANSKPSGNPLDNVKLPKATSQNLQSVTPTKQQVLNSTNVFDLKTNADSGTIKNSITPTKTTAPAKNVGSTINTEINSKDEKWVPSKPNMVAKKIVTKKSATIAKKKYNPVKKNFKACKNFKYMYEDDNEELDDNEILALLSSGIVLDECSGSDEN